MRVAFIQAWNPYDVQWSAPLWPAYLKAYAEQFVDAEWYMAHSNKDLWRIMPDVVAVSAHSQDWDEALDHVGFARKLGAEVVVGGHHVTSAMPEEDGTATYIRGPGEDAFASWLARIAGAEQPPLRAPGLDSIPMPDHSFGIQPGQKPYLLTSRGCPYTCWFCSPKDMWKKIQYHSPQRVIAEIKQIRRDFPGIKVIPIWDDLFAAKKSRVKEICELLEQEGIKQRFSSGMRAELVSDENCRLWVRMGLKRLGIGAESGSDNVLSVIKGDTAAVKKNQRALDTMHRHGIAAGAGMIFGTPGETEDDIRRSYEWLLENYRKGKLMQHSVNVMTPLPGTPAWHKAQEMGLLGDGFKWSRLRFISMSANNTSGRREWMDLRRKHGSVYMNEDSVPQETLFQMIDYYEDRIAWCSPAQIVRSVKRKIERELKK